MQAHCRTCRCEASGSDGQDFYAGAVLLDDKGNEISPETIVFTADGKPINLYDTYFVKGSKEENKSPDFQMVAGTLLSNCCGARMETGKDPAIAHCTQCGEPRAQLNEKQDGWVAYVPAEQ